MNAPLLTREVCAAFAQALAHGQSAIEVSLDLARSRVRVKLASDHWSIDDRAYPHLQACKDRTIYYWTGAEFAPVARFSQSLVKLVPTEWGAPTFEIDGVKMLPTAKVSPYADAQTKVALIEPRGKVVLDTCGGLGYFAAWCLAGGVERVQSFEKNPDVLWLRSLNPWSPGADSRLTLTVGDIATAIDALPSAAFDAVLHDPPRFALAGELYSQRFYDQLARVLKRKGCLFHYVGAPNALTSRRNVPKEVATRLAAAGFATQFVGDGVFARKRARFNSTRSRWRGHP